MSLSDNKVFVGPPIIGDANHVNYYTSTFSVEGVSLGYASGTVSLTAEDTRISIQAKIKLQILTDSGQEDLDITFL